MARELKTIQWNIGGAKTLRQEANPALISSYSVDGFKEIVDVLGQEEPDIITLQEIHKSQTYNQPQAIAEELGYPSWIVDTWSDSHIEIGQKLGQAIISKTPIYDHQSTPFYNPFWQNRWENGSYATTHDKGITSCITDLNGLKLLVQALHLFPFRKFNKDPLEEGRLVLDDVETKIKSYKGPRLLQGDFNIDFKSLRAYFPNLFALGMQEIIQKEETTPRGRRYDHVLYSGMTVVKSLVIKKDIKTDHFPIVTTFEI